MNNRHECDKQDKEGGQGKQDELDRLDANDDPWENGTLGCSAEHAYAVSADESKQLDKALGLEEISLRLDSDLVQRLKTLAASRGLNYRALMRHTLAQFARAASEK